MRYVMMLIIVVCLFTAACATPRVEYKFVPTTEYRIPEIPTIERPHLPIYDLTLSQSNFDDIFRAYATSIRLLLNYAQSQEEILQTLQMIKRRADELGRIEVQVPRQLSESSEPIDPVALSAMRSLTVTNIIDSEATQAFSDIVNRYELKKEEILHETSHD